MSMPGWEFTLVCSACALESESYPLQPFSQLFHGDLCLPAWSRKLGCYGLVKLDLSMERRKALEEPGALVALAQELSGPSMTVGVPSGLEKVTLTPEPVCPGCGAPAKARSFLEKE